MTTYRMSDGVLRAELEGDEVLLNSETGVYHLLNSSARRLVRALEDGSSLEQAIDVLANSPDVDAAQARTDAESFVRAMIDRGLLEEVP